MFRVSALAGVLALGALCTGCGSSSTSAAAPPTNANGLAPTSTPPTDFTTLASMVAALANTATCVSKGPELQQCRLVTATDDPFLLRVFPTPAATQAYLVTVHQIDEAAIGRAVTPIGALTGPHWIALPKVEAPGLIDTLRSYLGGTPFT